MAEALRELAARAEGRMPDIYGHGELIETLEARVAQLLVKPAALFLPSGVLAQLIATRIHCDQRRRSTLGLHPTSHLLLHEADSYRALWGLDHELLGDPDRVLTQADLQQADPQTLGAIVLELPMREIGGQLPAWDDLKAQVEWARRRDIAIHFDGARLWHCPAHYGRSLGEISALADSVYVSLYKDIGGIAGAVLAGEPDFIEQARVWNRRAGGSLHSFYPYLLAAERGLDDNHASIDEAVRYARTLGPMLATTPGIRCNPDPPQAAMFHLHIQIDQDTLLRLIDDYTREHDVIVLPPPRGIDAHGNSICEISVGRSTMAHPPKFWHEHLGAALGGRSIVSS
jgi:threonine aldolase